MNELVALLEELLPRYGGKRNKLAAAIGLSPSRLTRVLKGEYSLDVKNCLQLAKATGEPAVRVLRAAGKREIAVLIEELFGRQTITPQERMVLAQWARIPETSKPTVRDVLEQFAGQRRADEESPQRSSFPRRGRPPR